MARLLIGWKRSARNNIASLDAFEQTLGPMDQVQVEWHAYVRHLKDVLSGEDLERQKAQRLSGSTNSVPQ